MISHRFFFVFFCLFLLSATSVGWAATDSPTVETFDHWAFVCRQEKGQKKECTVTQEIQGRDEKGAYGRLARVTVIRKEDGKGYVLGVLMPLGINLQAGAAIAIDDKPQKEIKLLRCTSAGCEAGMEAKNELLREMMKGTTLKVGFNAGVQTLVVPVPLKGLEAAMRRYATWKG